MAEVVELSEDAQHRKELILRNLQVQFSFIEPELKHFKFRNHWELTS